MNSRVALVTGGSRGIGRGIAEALGGEGWTVAIGYRWNSKAAAETLEAVNNYGGDGFCVPGDISSLEDHQSLVDTVLKKTGRIDLLVNNAGISPRKRGDMLEVSPESFDEVMETNLKGPFFLTRRIASVMIDLVKKKVVEEPKIINIGSISAEAVSLGRAEYCISKAGIAMMTRLWAARLAEHGILVYEIRPGIIKTDMTKVVKDKYDKLFGEGLTLIPRWGTPEEIGKLVAALAGGLLPYSTGEVIHVDGGFHVPRL